MSPDEFDLFSTYLSFLIYTLSNKPQTPVDVQVPLDLPFNNPALSIDTRRLAKCSFEPLGNLEHHTIREALPKDRDRERHPIFSKPSRT
jgi:hypothetical protein